MGDSGAAFGGLVASSGRNGSQKTLEMKHTPLGSPVGLMPPGSLEPSPTMVHSLSLSQVKSIRNQTCPSTGGQEVHTF